MAIVTMKHLRLLALKSDRASLLTDLQHMGCVEIDEPTVDWNDPTYEALTQPDSAALTTAREKLSTAERALAILKARVPEKGGLLRARPRISKATLFDAVRTEETLAVAQDLVESDRHIAACKAEQTKLSGQMTALLPWQTLDIPLETQSTATLAVHLGTVPNTVPLSELEGAAQAVSDLVQFNQLSSDRELHYLLLLCHASVQEDIMEALRPMGWARANFRDTVGTAQQNLTDLQTRHDELARSITETEEKILTLVDERENLKLLEDTLAQDVRRETARTNAVDSDTAFLIEGWIPAERCDHLVETLKPYICAYEMKEPTEDEYHTVPVQLKNNWFTRPLNMVTDMYSLPAYGGLDPNPLMAPFFILFFGVMMADMGYGILMMLAGGLILAKTNPARGTRNFAGLALLCGVSTFIWGVITGGFFGDFIPQFVLLTTGKVIALPSLFSPLDDALMVLIGSLALGVIQVITAMIISMVKQIRRGKTMDAICNEGAWFAIFFAIGIGAALGNLQGGFIAAGVILVASQCYGKKSIPAILLGIFGSLYNKVTGYFSDILSYSRLMALMLSGAVIAQVFNTLGALSGNLIVFLIVSFLGNSLNFGLNLLGCYVHDLRLQCLEYFGRFYEDGGKAFKPLSIDTKHVEVVE